MNIVSMSLCYPSEEAPYAGLFVRSRLQSLAQSNHVRMVHPIPTPFWLGRRGVKKLEGPPPVWRVVMPYLPKFGKPLNPYLYARSVMPLVRDFKQRDQVDIIDAHFSWPDGVAAARVAGALGIPYTVTLRGVLNRYCQNFWKRRSIVSSLQGASGVIAVSSALKEDAVRLGVPADRVHVIPNGIDSEVFRYGDQSAARQALNLPRDETILITVGHLCRRKGFHRVLRVLPKLLQEHGKLRYVMAGGEAAEGRFERRLRAMVKELGLEDRVTFTGHLEPTTIATWLQASDLFVLPTSNEGWCNALGESIACGVPVLATDVGGNGEIVSPTSGLLIPMGSDRALLAGINRMLNARPHRLSIARAFPIRTWSTVASETSSVMRNALHRSSERRMQVRQISSPAPA